MQRLATPPLVKGGALNQGGVSPGKTRGWGIMASATFIPPVFANNVKTEQASTPPSGGI